MTASSMVLGTDGNLAASSVFACLTNKMSLGEGTSRCKNRDLADWLMLVVSFLVASVVITLLLPVMLMFRIYRAVLKKQIQQDLGDNVLMVSGDDSFWLQDKAENRGIINSLVKLEGKMDLEKYRKTFEERLVMLEDRRRPGKRLFPKLASYSAKILHRYVWLPESRFDIRDHVYAHPQPWPKDKTDMEYLIGELCSAPLPVNKSPWQFIVLNPAPGHPDYDKYHYAIFRVHHSIADGISWVRVFLKYMVDEPPPEGGTERFGTKRLVRNTFMAIFQGPHLLLSRLTRPADSNIMHGPRLSGVKSFSWSKPIDLDLVKRIKNATNSTVNDVLVACLASGFRRYFQRHAAEIPTNILAYIPVDVRPSSAEITLDNQFALVFLDLPLNEEDPVKTLHETKSRMDRIKASPEPIVNALAIKYCMNRLPGWLTELAFDWAAAKSTLVLSNVPGPQKKLRFASTNIESMVFWPPQRTNVGLSVSIFSYSGSITIGINADCRILSNSRILVDMFYSEVHRLAKGLNL